jgi:hypothetical protein
LIQFVYCLVGGLICYIIYQLFPTSLGWVLLVDIPIALTALALAFLKIQDQPLSHFILAGIEYFRRPKIRFWKRFGQNPVVIQDIPKVVKKQETTQAKRKIEKSDLEKLAYVLDTKPLQQDEQQNFGKITRNFEKVISDASGSQQYNQIFNQKGGKGGTLGQVPTANR